MKSKSYAKLLAVAAIVASWIPDCSPILSSSEWIEASQETLQDSTNQLVIKKIPNAACDKLSQTRDSGCHASDATRLAKWFFSLKCIIRCNQGFGLPLGVIQDVEINCRFAENNTLNMTMGEVEWSAHCHCPVGSIYSGSNFTIDDVSYSLMADEYAEMKCYYPGAPAETVSSGFKYSFASCRENPSICDRHATCMGDVCICAPGYTGNGFDCYYYCHVPSIELALTIEDSKGISMSAGDLIEELDIAAVTCDQLDRKMYDLTCGCDGLSANKIYCGKAVYLVGGRGEDEELDSIAVFYPEAPFKSYISHVKLANPRYVHVSYLMKNGSLIVINGRSDLDAIEMVNPGTNMGEAVRNNPAIDIFSQTLNEIDDELYVCGGCDESGGPIADCFKISLETGDVELTYPMLTARCILCSFVIDKVIYAVGGWTKDTNAIHNMQMLNVSASSPWQDRKPYPADIMGCAAASYAGLGYACGGRIEDGVTDGCNVYDPNMDTWAPIAQLNEKRSFFSMIQLDGVLYSIFGMNENDEYLTTIEYFNITGDRKWTTIPGMIDLLGQRDGYSVAYSWN